MAKAAKPKKEKGRKLAARRERQPDEGNASDRLSLPRELQGDFRLLVAALY